MQLIPWERETPLKLSEVYTAMEMESYHGRYRMRVATPLKDYKELFAENLKPEDTRILVKGDPGIGKTTFTHKVAFDWATGSLDLFDVMFVTKLKFAEKDQSLESIIKSQINLVRNSNVSDEMLAKYLRSGKDRVLLVLDGLDEINLKKFPKIQEIIHGEAYRKCTILVTSRPNVTHTVHNKMTTLAKLKGFSRRKAEEFVSHILTDKDERQNFFNQLQTRRMSTMYRTPILVQALALLFREDENMELPATYTSTYDQLLLFLIRNCKESKGLSEKEIEEARAALNELAFKGLIRDDRQLIFNRDEVTNENIFKLGILAAEKAGSGYKPTIVLQFPHKTVQEHSAADHVSRRLTQNDTMPWETIKNRLFTGNDNDSQDESSQSQMTPSQTPSLSSLDEDEDARERILFCQAYSKFRDVFQGKVVLDLASLVLENGGFEEPDVPRLWEAISRYNMVNVHFSQEEAQAIFDFVIKDIVLAISIEERKIIQKWATEKIADGEVAQFSYGVKIINTMVVNDRDNGLQYIKDLLAAMSIHDDSIPFQYNSQEFMRLWETITSDKIFLTFIAGQLSINNCAHILCEIAEAIVQHSLDPLNGDVLPFFQVQSFMGDLIKERPQDDGLDFKCLNPVLLHISSSLSPLGQLALPGKSVKHSALRMSGKPQHDKTVNMQNITKQLEQLNSFYITEFDNVPFPNEIEPADIKGFLDALYQSPIASLQLTGVHNDHLLAALLWELPESVQRLSIYRCKPAIRFYLPDEVNLTYLYIEDCPLDARALLRGRFNHLQKLHVILTWVQHGWTPKEVGLIRDAVMEGRMPQLKDLQIRYVDAKDCGEDLVELLSQNKMTSLDLLACNLSFRDGQLILDAIRNNELDHLNNLNLDGNPNLSPLIKDYNQECRQRGIHLHISSTTRKPTFWSLAWKMCVFLFSYIRNTLSAIYNYF